MAGTLAALSPVMPAPALGAQSSAAPECALETVATRSVARVLDAETVQLDDGSEVRLIGALAPRARDAGAQPNYWEPEQVARAALDALIAGQSVEVAHAGRRTDRYGRLLAHLYRPGVAGRVWVQGYMVENGHARAYALPGNTVCISELLALEARARSAGLGLWQGAAYQTRAADRPAELMRWRDTFQLIEGIVRSASDIRGQLYLNFGQDWRTDFTAHVGVEQRRASTAAGVATAALEGRRVRVRGWIVWRNGPQVTVEDAREIEILE